MNAGDIVELARLAADGGTYSARAAAALYDDFGINDEDRAALLAHEGRV